MAAHSAIDTVVLTAVPEETEAVVRTLGSTVTHTWRGSDLQVGTVNGHGVLVFPLHAMGTASAAQGAQRAISIWNPARLMIVGITGGARDADNDLRLGDVLVPDQVIGYEHARAAPDGLRRRYEVYRPSHELLTIARSVRRAEWALEIMKPRPDDETRRVVPKAHFGPVLSGDKVVADDVTVPSLRRDWPLAIGIEMEGLGVAIASYRGGPGFLLVKAVSDFADSARGYDWHAYAAEAAACFAVAVLARLPSPEHVQPRPQAVPSTGTRSYPGRVKLQICRRLDNWQDVADYFDVPPHDKARFPHGDEARGLWEYLEVRDKLVFLPDAFDAVGRVDLADVLRASATGS